MYTASSIALAVLETLVHVDLSIMPKHFVIPVDVPESVAMTSIDVEELSDDWRATPAPAALQNIGRDWLDSGGTALLKIPSVVVPQEFNVIINPIHTDFRKLRIDKPDSFTIDTRLL